METAGFDFYTDEDAKMAEAEQRRIDYLEERIDYTRPESILHVYDKAIHEQLFKTPLGLMYLKRLQDFLLKQPQIAPERVKAIPLYDTYATVQRPRANSEKANEREEQKKAAEATRFQISVILNILLVLAVLAMFIISFFSEQPNIFNYERALLNKYSAWEEELSAREQTIRDKERELDLDSLNNTQVQ